MLQISIPIPQNHGIERPAIMNMTRKTLLALALTAVFSPAITTTAFAQLHLEIAKAPEEAPKIAIVPFANDQSIYPIVEGDLNRSGRFTSSSKNLPASAALNNINAQSWQATKIPYIVTGSIKSVAGDSYEVHYQLYDVEKQTYLLNELLTVPASRIRQAGHMISDAIYQALTGIPGDFSGRIAYVLRNPATPEQRYTLQIADTDGEQPRTVLSSRDPILSPAWTPDAKNWLMSRLKPSALRFTCKIWLLGNVKYWPVSVVLMVHQASLQTDSLCSSQRRCMETLKFTRWI